MATQRAGAGPGMCKAPAEQTQGKSKTAENDEEEEYEDDQDEDDQYDNDDDDGFANIATRLHCHTTLCHGDEDNMFHATPIRTQIITANAMHPLVWLGLVAPSPRQWHSVTPPRTQIPPMR